MVEGDATARMMKPGLYDFNLRQNRIRVFDGQAIVQDDDKQIKLKGGHELTLASNVPAKAEGFDKKAYETGDLYNWSSLRSDYVAEANVKRPISWLRADGGVPASGVLDGGAPAGRVGIGIHGSRHTRSCPGMESSTARLGGDSIHRASCTKLRSTVDISITPLMRRTFVRGVRVGTMRQALLIRTVSTPELEPSMVPSTQGQRQREACVVPSLVDSMGGGSSHEGFHGGMMR